MYGPSAFPSSWWMPSIKHRRPSSKHRRPSSKHRAAVASVVFRRFYMRQHIRLHAFRCLRQHGHRRVWRFGRRRRRHQPHSECRRRRRRRRRWERRSRGRRCRRHLKPHSECRRRRRRHHRTRMGHTRPRALVSRACGSPSSPHGARRWVGIEGASDGGSGGGDRDGGDGDTETGTFTMFAAAATAGYGRRACQECGAQTDRMGAARAAAAA